MGVDRKRAMFDRLAADVIVVPECSSAPRFSQELGVSFEWRGVKPSKGLGVFALHGWTVVPVAEATPLPWVLPLHIIDPAGRVAALLLAIWTVQLRGNGTYAQQVGRAVDVWAEEIRRGPTLLAGDLNCTAQGSPPRHCLDVARLERLGAVSAYHAHQGLGHGREEAMTLRWIGPGGEPKAYHCDFVFASADLLPAITRVEVGTFGDWIETGMSDHCPVIVDFDRPSPVGGGRGGRRPR